MKEVYFYLFEITMRISRHPLEKVPIEHHVSFLFITVLAFQIFERPQNLIRALVDAS